MILIIREKATKKQIEQMLEEYKDQNYIKVVVDIEEGFLAGGGEYHFDAEQLLLEDGSKQENLWGGGIDMGTSQIDYNSMINQRPNQNNLGRDVASPEIREKMDQIIKKLIL